MAVYYDLPAHDNALLEAFRLIFGTLMIVSLVLGVTSILRRDVARHRLWMMRAYAIGLGAGTQVLRDPPVDAGVRRARRERPGAAHGLLVGAEPRGGRVDRAPPADEGLVRTADARSRAVPTLIP